MALRIALAQLNLLVGDIEGNAGRIINAAARARDEQQADLIVFPELTLTGYPPEDLLLRSHFIEDCEAAMQRILRDVQGVTAIVGHPVEEEGVLYNVASVVRDGSVVARYRKQHLPNYGVFDENLNMHRDPGEAKVYFEFSDYSTPYVFFEHPHR